LCDYRGHDRFWILVDLGRELAVQPAYFVLPEGWILNYIYERSEVHLARHGGQRPNNPRSTHFAIRPRDVAQWHGRWDILPIFGSVALGDARHGLDEKRVLWVLSDLPSALDGEPLPPVAFEAVLEAVHDLLRAQGLASPSARLPAELRRQLRALQEAGFVDNPNDDHWELTHAGWTLSGAWRPWAAPSA
jgi:hypothetical protein